VRVVVKGPSVKCQAARKRRRQLAHSIANLKRHVKRADGLSARRRYQRKLTHRRVQYRHAKSAERKACGSV
jgi:hypothetical protein